MPILDDPRFMAVVDDLIKKRGYVSLTEILMIQEAIASTDMEK